MKGYPYSFSNIDNKPDAVIINNNDLCQSKINRSIDGLIYLLNFKGVHSHQ